MNVKNSSFVSICKTVETLQRENLKSKEKSSFVSKPYLQTS